MLKLLKHDIKDNYLEVVITNGLLIGLSFFVLLAIKTKTQSLFAVLLAAWGIILCAAFCMILVSIIKSFHSKLFSNQGYLTLTTPVSIDKILLSKIIVNMLWIIFVYITVVLSALIVISSITDFSLFPSFFESFAKNPLAGFKVAVSLLLSALNLITTLIFVLVLVNSGRMKKHKLVKGLLIYIGVSIVISSTNPFQIRFISLFIGGQAGNFLVSLIISIAWSVLLYFVSRHLITRKLELE